MEAYRLFIDICTSPKHSRWICPLLLLADSILCYGILSKIACKNTTIIPHFQYQPDENSLNADTEIDWSTYMQQVSSFLSGERDYTMIKGSTGPLVYPAGHVYVYTALHYVTDGGYNVALGQCIFAGLYLATLALAMASYRSASAPPYIFPLLILSKRLHSIFMLRLFNDGVATLFLWATIVMLQRRRWHTAVVLWSAGVSIKMTLLLVAPALAVILTLALGFPNAFGLGIMSLLIQILLATPFLQANPIGYFSRAFELTRQFLFKWTTNWRFVGEQTFLSTSFSLSLLLVHVSLLFFFLYAVWLSPSGKSTIRFVREIAQGHSSRYDLTSSFISKTMLSSLVIGLLCARSLHYQFFSYLAWATPLLLWESNFPPLLIFILCIAQEYAWNVFPSTTGSSLTVVACLAVQVLAPALS